MPRNTSGFYTLPLPPVVSGTIIESVWANDTLADIAQALTESLSTQGEGGMQVEFRLFDGTVAAPGLAFTAETNSGLFRESTGVLGMSVLGVKRQQWTANGSDIYGNLSVSGNIAAPGGTSPWVLKVGDSMTGMLTIAPPLGGPAGLTINRSFSGGSVNSYIVLTNGTTQPKGYLAEAAVRGGLVAAMGARYDISGVWQLDPGVTAFAGTTWDPLGFMAFFTGAGYAAGGGFVPTERMRIDAAGNVGIGTATPVLKFAVSNGVTRLEVDPGASAVGLQALNEARTATVPLSLAGSVNTFWTGAAGGQAERMRIDSFGNVGINVAPTAFTNTGATLQVKGFTAGQGGHIAVTSQDNTTWLSLWSGLTAPSNGPALTWNNTTELRIGTTTDAGIGGFVERMRIDAAGNVGIGTATPQSTLSVGNNDAAAVITPGNTNGHITLASTGASGAVLFRTNSVERMRIDAAGQVGINVQAQGAWLHVSASPSGGLPLLLKHHFEFGGANAALRIDGDVGTLGHGYIGQAPASGGLWLAAGAHYSGSGNYLTDPASTSYAAMQLVNGDVVFYSNAGLAANGLFAPTERARLTAAGVFNITNANITNLTVAGSPASGSRFESAEQAVPQTQIDVTVAHGGTRPPDTFMAVLRCKVGELGYGPGNEVVLKNDVANVNREVSLCSDATNLTFSYFPGSPAPVAIRNLSSRALQAVTPANWALVFRATWS